MISNDKISIDGKWKVIGLSGILPALIGNEKYIKKNVGYNRWLGIFKWGVFDITYKKGKIIFTYRKGGIVDKLESVDENKLTGRFYHEGKFVGRFKMVRFL